jgi:hypothetical protein
MIFFNNCDVVVNGTGVMAEQVSLSTSNAIVAVRGMGNNLAVTSTPDGQYANNIRMSYYLEIEKDPVYANVSEYLGLVNNITNPNYENIPANVIGVAGITGVYYLDSYSLTVSANEVIKANASYVGFTPPTGIIKKRDFKHPYAESFSGLAHAWTANLIEGEGDIPILEPVYDFSYNFRSVINPIYALGDKYPKQVMLLTAEETIMVVKETNRINVSGRNEDAFPITFYGESGWQLFSGLKEDGSSFNEYDLIFPPRVKIEPLSGLCDDSNVFMEFNFSGMKVESSDVSIDANDFAKSSFSLRRYH